MQVTSSCYVVTTIVPLAMLSLALKSREHLTKQRAAD